MNGRSPGFSFLSPDPARLAHYARSLGLPWDRALGALARTLAGQIGPESHPAALVLRPPHLILLHRVGPAEASRIQRQARSVDEACGSLLYVDPGRAFELCRKLAASLTDRYGDAAFSAIPAGGAIVLEHLAPVLGPERLGSPPDHDRLLVVVDDCAISGLRFRQFLDSCPGRRIVFAHLYSHPALRAAIEEREPRVIACVSAADLREIDREVPPEHRRRRQERIARGEGYWIGSTEALCFPWNEPDRSFWNPETGRQERAWRIVPPEFCRKNQAAPATVPVQVQPEGKGPLRPSSRVVFGDLQEQTVLCDLKTGACFGLEGVSADLWSALLEYGQPEAVADALQDEYDVPREVFRMDTLRFFEDLETRGLIEWTETD